MDKIAVFYHCYQIDGWETVYYDFIYDLHRSGLGRSCSKIHVNIIGNTTPDDVGLNIDYTYTDVEVHNYEGSTLTQLLEFARSNPDYKIMYAHTKGITQRTVESYYWRKAMQQFVVLNWVDNLRLLDDHDAVGILLKDKPRTHFSGNFWWSTSRYIVELDHSMLYNGNRYDQEFWIGSGGGSLHSLFQNDLNLYYSRLTYNLWA